MSTNTINNLNNRGDDADADRRRLINLTLAAAGVFFFVNGVHVAFFSSSLLLSVGYYATVGLGVASVGLLLVTRRRSGRGVGARGARPTLPTLLRRLQGLNAKRTGRRKRGGMDRL